LGDEFEVDNCLSFEYRYGSLLPEGLLPRFIVRAYTRIEGGLRWRSGVVLSWKRARALVKADEPDRQILIRVHGPLNSRRELLALVREHFDTIHRNFKKLEPLEMIRIPQEPDLLVEYPKVEAFAINPSADFTEFHKGTIYQLDAEQILAQFELPGARRDPRFRGAASAQLALGLSVRSKKRAN
jgi:hypothetical protein